MKRLVLFIFFFSVFIGQRCFSQDDPEEKLRNARIHAIFLYNFTRYFEWPNFMSKDDFKIGVMADGDTNLLSQLKRLAAMKKIGESEIKILEFKSIEEIKPTEILYIDVQLHPEVELNKYLKKSTLLVTENNPNFKNSIISFIMIDGKMKFALNKENVKNSNLIMSPDFEKLAIVTEAEWNSTFDKFSFLLKKNSKNEIKVTRKDLEEVVSAQEENLKAIKKQKKELDQKIKFIDTQKEEIKKQEGMQEAQRREIEKQKSELNEKVEYIRQQEGKISGQEAKAAELNKEITQKSNVLELTKREIEVQNQALENQKVVLMNKEKEISAKRKVLESQQTEITEQKGVLDQQRNIIILFIFLLGMIILLLVFVAKSLRKNKQQKKVIMEKQMETELQKHMLEIKQKEILDSIRYAKRIQLALMSSEKKVESDLNKLRKTRKNP